MTVTLARRPRVSRPIPFRSKCCEGNILPQAGFLYCDRCRTKIVDFSGPRRIAALKSLYWIRWWPDDLSLMWRNLRVAEAYKWIHYSPSGREVLGHHFQWVIGTSNCDFYRIGTALGVDCEDMDYPGRDPFSSLDAAAEDLWRYLADRHGEQNIRHWSTAPVDPVQSLDRKRSR